MRDGSLALLKAAPLPEGGNGGGGGGGGGRRGVVGVHSVVRDGRVKALEDVKFAPGSGLYAGGLLACGGHERTIDVYEVVTDGRSGEHRLSLQLRSRCKGHSSTVLHLDWSCCGRLLLTNCAAREALCWQMPSGKRVPQAGQYTST